MRSTSSKYLLCVLLLMLPACTASPSATEQSTAPAATQASYQRDGRNLAPGLRPYGGDPLFPFQDYGAGGGGGRR